MRLQGGSGLGAGRKGGRQQKKWGDPRLAEQMADQMAKRITE